MKLFLLLGLVTFTFSLRFDGDQVLTLYPQTPGHIELIREFDSFDTLADFWSPDNVDSVHIGSGVDIRFKSGNLRMVKKKIASVHMNYVVKIDNLQTLIDNQFNNHKPRDTKAHDYNVYHTYDEINQWTNDITTQHPNLVSRELLIKSEEGREIPKLTLDPQKNTGKPIILIDCGIHAREWISPAFCQCFVNRMVSNYGTNPDVTNYMDKLQIIVLPLLNVDGYAYTWSDDRMWRKTRSNYGTACTGVDPNRNFDAGWSGPGASASPCSDTYYGPEVESEQLTKGLSNLIRANQGNIQAYLTFHSYSQFIIYPYSYKSADVDNQDEHDGLASRMALALQNVYGKRYDYGAGWSSFYLAAGGSDDMAKDYGSPISYTVELRDTGRYGFILPENQIEPSCLETYALVDEVLKHVLG